MDWRKIIVNIIIVVTFIAGIRIYTWGFLAGVVCGMFYVVVVLTQWKSELMASILMLYDEPEDQDEKTENQQIEKGQG